MNDAVNPIHGCPPLKVRVAAALSQNKIVDSQNYKKKRVRDSWDFSWGLLPVAFTLRNRGRPPRVPPSGAESVGDVVAFDAVYNK